MHKYKSEKIKTKQAVMLLAVLCATHMLSSCSDSSYTPPAPDDAQTLTLSVTDAPLDGVSKVLVQFAGVEVKPVGADVKTIMFDTPVDVDILSLQGKRRVPIMLDHKLATGEYEYIRLLLNATQGEFNSLVLLDDNTWQSLYVPDGDKIGLKIVQSFKINSQNNTHLTIDFDLRKSISKESTEDAYRLSPSLRWVKESGYGHIAGFIDNALLLSNGCIDSNNHSYGSIYLYPALADGQLPQDIQRNANDPISSANIEFDVVNGEYSYTMGYIPSKTTYSAVLVCDARLDDPVTADTLTFVGTPKSITVAADVPNDLNF